MRRIVDDADVIEPAPTTNRRSDQMTAPTRCSANQHGNRGTSPSNRVHSFSGKNSYPAKISEIEARSSALGFQAVAAAAFCVSWPGVVAPAMTLVSPG